MPAAQLAVHLICISTFAICGLKRMISQTRVVEMILLNKVVAGLKLKDGQEAQASEESSD